MEAIEAQFPGMYLNLLSHPITLTDVVHCRDLVSNRLNEIKGCLSSESIPDEIQILKENIQDVNLHFQEHVVKFALLALSQSARNETEEKALSVTLAEDMNRMKKYKKCVQEWRRLRKKIEKFKKCQAKY